MAHAQHRGAPASSSRMPGAVPTDRACLGAGHAGGAGAAALSEATSDNARGQAGEVDLGDSKGRNHSAESGAERKLFEKLQARGARAGCGLYELASGGFVLTRWSLMRELPSLRAVEQLFNAMGMRQ